MATHTNERKYVCEVCQSAYKQVGHLTTHMMTHGIGIKRWYACKLCQKYFYNKGNYKVSRLGSQIVPIICHQLSLMVPSQRRNTCLSMRWPAARYCNVAVASSDSVDAKNWMHTRCRNMSKLNMHKIQLDDGAWMAAIHRRFTQATFDTHSI